jgi:hypothetical protein
LYYPINALSIDYNALRIAIEQCKKTHLACHDMVAGDVSFLKLIDCQTREVLPASSRPSQNYAALSYVWGKSDHGIGHVRVLLLGLLATIEDAMLVTIRLGIRYLWIDRYCINQENEMEVKYQIASMNIIYRKATITIIAACGEDPFYGLTGVSSRCRLGMPSLDIANIQFFQEPWSSFKFVERVKDSRWNQRAWTYQEAVFSRARLVFTQQEVYIDCLQASDSELFNFGIVGFQGTRFCEDIRSMLPTQFLKASDSREYISTYSGRVLGHPEDIIKALSGVLNACEVDTPFAHYWGIPVLLPHYDSTESVYSLVYSPVQTFICGIK